MPKFDIPIIATVEANNINEARQLAYKTVEVVNDLNMKDVDLVMADDSETDNYNQRMVFLHPNDVDVNYDIEAYNRALDKDDEE